MSIIIQMYLLQILRKGSEASSMVLIKGYLQQLMEEEPTTQTQVLEVSSLVREVESMV